MVLWLVGQSCDIVLTDQGRAQLTSDCSDIHR
jgi:hypothetical protein